MTLAELLTMTDTEIKIFATISGRCGAQIINCDLKDSAYGHVLRSCAALGDTPIDALIELARTLSQKLLVINAMIQDKRKEIQLPRITT